VNDVNLLSKDMELNFSNKNDDEEEIDVKPQIIKDGRGQEFVDGIEDISIRAKTEEAKSDFFS
jgi:hypothetical protein